MREEDIPQDIRDAARAAGLKLPMWYVGRRGGKPRRAGPTAREVVLQARREAGLCAECVHPHGLGEPHNNTL